MFPLWRLQESGGVDLAQDVGKMLSQFSSNPGGPGGPADP